MSTTTTQIKIPNFAWKALDYTVKQLVTAINANRPLEGAGIRLSSSGNDGTLIETTEAVGGGQLNDIGVTPDGQIAGWHQISVVTVDPVLGCIEQVIWYWGTAPFS